MSKPKEEAAVLVAQDGSPAALAAASVAIQIARRLELAIHPVYVVDEGLALDTYADYGHELGQGTELVSRAQRLASFEAQGDAALQLIEDRCQAAGVPLRAELLAGAVPEMILRLSEASAMLAIGRRGLGHPGDPQHLGRTFRAVAHRARVPLIIGGDQERTVRRLLLAYNGSERARDALGWATRLQHSLPAEVMVVAVHEHEGDRTAEWLAEAQSRLPGCQCLERVGQPAHGIVAAAEETRAGLLVIGRYRHIPLMEWLIGSTVDRLLRGSQLPVLMV